MKYLIASLIAAGMTGMASAQTYVTNAVPGGGFEPADPEYSDITSSMAAGNLGATIFDFPSTGGNPNGYARINCTNPAASWAVIVLGNTTPVDLTTLGLAPNIPCTFLMDMKIEAGAGIGGLKVESWGSSGKISDTGDVFPASGTGSWATYSFPFTPAIGATGVKIVPLRGAGSTVGFDNVKVVALSSLPLSAQITSPANGATVNTNFSILANATVYPATITSVDFYRGATLLGTATTAPYSYNVTSAATGSAALKVVAHDSNGNSATSSVVNVTVTAAVPTTIVRVDPAQTWQTYMNVFESPQNGLGYDFGVYGWGTDALVALFAGAGPASTLSLYPAKLGDTDPYWYDYSDPSYPVGTNGAVGRHNMQALKYVQLADGSVNGNVVTFTGTCITNTLDVNQNPARTNKLGNGWTVYAFVKDLAPDYSSFNQSVVALTNGQTFSVSLLTSPDTTRHIQYGFVTEGPNVWPTDYTNYGKVAVQSLDASPTNVTVNSTAGWVGYMNVFNKPQDGGAYQFGSGWGTADLCAVFNGFGLVLSPNTIGDPNGYWYTPSGGPGSVGNKTMDASMYVEIGSFPGRNLTFSGTVLSNSLVSASNTNALGNGWTSVAFIKDFAPDYSSFNSATIPLTPGAFSVNLYTVNDPARHVQYGFETIGPDVWVTDVAQYGKVVIANTAVLPPNITPSSSGNNLNLTFATQLGHTYTVQYRTNLLSGSWSTLTTTNGTGLNATVGDVRTGSSRFYRVSAQ